ncbi:BZ3500_MvSof-1268-A1-R1_Chr1-3g02444 [Microbotryum saponariae]|uniref:BZ3500_MvSof-1268-A1-R1_Chr1-3g02444 protein n=1 Tax=Microbotryum saponariae TaxID=289078 RepID=A0A2X0KV46_9BASI|nr:BZ3500_MvSof-1268-A1-R1_Chr1-3g02444 [Microbotryum saponariae]SCZ96248.1 BZ3501_MvSof-1269-A2-R1_Chr1-3g02047 [Microbotryum saponariae]
MVLPVVSAAALGLTGNCSRGCKPKNRREPGKAGSKTPRFPSSCRPPLRPPVAGQQDHSREFWRLTLQLLRVALGQAGDFQPGEVDSPQIMLGLPRVRGESRDSRTYIVVRVVLAIAFNKLYLARWHQHKDQIPLPTPYFLSREVRSHLKFRLRRLPDGELLDQMMVVGAHMIGITLLVVSGVWGLHGSSGYNFT